MQEITVVQALLLGLFSFLCNTGAFPLGWISMNIVSKPLIQAFIIGLICGDVTTAMTIGCVIQSVYIGQMSIGGIATLPTITISLWFALPISIFSGADAETTLTICLAFAAVEQFFKEIGNIFKQFILHADDALIEKGKIKLAVWFPFSAHIWTFVSTMIVVPVLCLAGPSVVTSIVESMPEWLSGILNVYISLVPAIGFMMLLVTLIHQKMQFVFFIFGFMLCSAMGLSTISITAIASVVAYVMFLCLGNQTQTEGN